jgi:hypothetical protein
VYLLKEILRLTEIQEKNQATVAAQEYHGQTESLGKYRYLLQPYDTGNLYIQYFCAVVDITGTP